jgi:hypothetical protein
MTIDDTIASDTDTGLRCSRCAAPFHCGMDDAGACWCTELPNLPAAVLDAAQGCLCEACLRSELERAGIKSAGRSTTVR